MSRETSGVLLEMPRTRTPGLRFEVAAGNRMLLRQHDNIVLFARVLRNHFGVSVYRTSAYESPIPPIEAAMARRFTAEKPSSSAWLDRWAHRYAGWLVDAEDGPLHCGIWLLGQRDLPEYCLTTDLVADFPAAHLDWMAQGWNGVLPLRKLPDRDAARVKAFRKQARDRVLPPLLLWSVSGLDGYLLLDGHHRLAAAKAEQIRPDVLLLARHTASDQAAEPKARAWLHNGGAAAWEQNVQRAAPGWERRGE
ncbi:ParB/Srx family N-terminal domain-containing protein [Krasilnikovia sp. MM14-A1259]|uniref:ParB/Srx family N-terminal domain-containing protein n=1 Tax=Krasilnikovia sp. MM14-A1259 TaxID=3373539 RepID=UPI00399C4BB6